MLRDLMIIIMPVVSFEGTVKSLTTVRNTSNINKMVMNNIIISWQYICQLKLLFARK